MKNRILLIISFISLMIFVSCGEDVDGGGAKPMSWNVESVNGDVNVSVKKEKVSVSCGPTGGVICLKSSSLVTIYPLFTHDSDDSEFNEYNMMIRFNNELCKVWVEANLLYIEFPPCSTKEKQELEFAVSDGGQCFSYGSLYVTRQP